MDELSMRRAIERKRDGATLEGSVWEGVIAAYVSGDVDDAQMAALAMACVWRGLDATESVALTRAMVASGATLRYPDGMFVVDKHSSGGVSDIVSLVAVPLVAACGVRVAKLSGRALGHTGGTIDKLEAIDGSTLRPRWTISSAKSSASAARSRPKATRSFQPISGSTSARSHRYRAQHRLDCRFDRFQKGCRLCQCVAST